MHFDNEEIAAKLLANVSYYHLGFYWFDLRHKIPPAEPVGNFAAAGTSGNSANNTSRAETFRTGSNFSEACTRYCFDFALRSAVTDCLQKLEQSFKTKWVYHFSHKYGPLFYRDKNIYDARKYKSKNADNIITKAEQNFQNSTEFFIQNYKRKHPNQAPEAWILAEILSFGELIYFISFLKQKDKQEFTHLYAENSSDDFLKQSNFISILNQLRLIRNICAHNGWLWNRSFNGRPTLPKTSPLLAEALNPKATQKLYNSLCFINYLLRSVEQSNNTRKKVRELMQAHPQFTSAMGFPRGWENTALWL